MTTLVAGLGFCYALIRGLSLIRRLIGGVL